MLAFRLYRECLLVVYKMYISNCWFETVTNTPGKHYHDDVIKWKRFPRYWPFVRETGHRWIPLTKGQ